MTKTVDTAQIECQKALEDAFKAMKISSETFVLLEQAEKNHKEACVAYIMAASRVKKSIEDLKELKNEAL